MGHWKPDGRCWSGNCQNQGTVELCTPDADGNPVIFCRLCHERTSAQLVLAAKRIANETAAKVGLPPIAEH